LRIQRIRELFDSPTYLNILISAAIRTRRHCAARGAAAAPFLIFIYGVPRRGAAACFIRHESAMARPRQFVPAVTVRRGMHIPNKFTMIRIFLVF
jgi:hypothetical protein